MKKFKKDDLKINNASHKTQIIWKIKNDSLVCF